MQWALKTFFFFFFFFLLISSLITLLVLAIWLLTAQSCPNILDFSRDVPYEGNTTPRPGLHTVSRLHLVEEWSRSTRREEALIERRLLPCVYHPRGRELCWMARCSVSSRDVVSRLWVHSHSRKWSYVRFPSRFQTSSLSFSVSVTVCLCLFFFFFFFSFCLPLFIRSISRINCPFCNLIFRKSKSLFVYLLNCFLI